MKAKRQYIPTRVEDRCWVKYGISVGGYLKSRIKWMNEEEIAIDLCTTRSNVENLMRKYKLLGKGWRGWRRTKVL